MTSAIGKAATKAAAIVEVNALSKFTSWRTVTVDYCARRNWIVGSPATVTDKIETIYHEVGGFGTRAPVLRHGDSRRTSQVVRSPHTW